MEIRMLNLNIMQCLVLAEWLINMRFRLKMTTEGRSIKNTFEIPKLAVEPLDMPDKDIDDLFD